MVKQTRILIHLMCSIKNSEILESGPKSDFLACQDLLRNAQWTGVKFKLYKLDGADQTAMAYRPFGTLHLFTRSQFKSLQPNLAMIEHMRKFNSLQHHHYSGSSSCVRIA